MNWLFLPLSICEGHSLINNGKNVLCVTIFCDPVIDRYFYVGILAVSCANVKRNIVCKLTGDFALNFSAPTAHGYTPVHVCVC